MAPKINMKTRIGARLRALLDSPLSSGYLDLTVTLYGEGDCRRYRQRFRVRKWVGEQGVRMLTVETLKDRRRPAAGVRHMNTVTGRRSPARGDAGLSEVLQYAADAALRYAYTGSAPKPPNGRVEIVEGDVCAPCGAALYDPGDIAIGICSGCRGSSLVVHGGAPVGAPA